MLRRFRFPWRTPRHIRRDIDDEVALHLALRAEELERRGLTPAAARDAARREFGDVDATRRRLAAAGRRAERARRVRTLIEALAHDGRYALRSLRRSPGFSLAATLVLALGVGSSVVVFSLLDTLVLRPVPLRAADRLVQIGTRPPADAQWTMQTVRLSVVEQWQRDAESFEALAAFEPRPLTWEGPAGPERVTGAGVVGDLFGVLGAPMAAGRPFTAAEHDENPAVLSHAFWRRRLGGRADVVGETIELDGVTHTIVGVLPPETELPFLGAEQRLVWIPRAIGGAVDGVFVHVVGRLRAGVEPGTELRELATIQRRVEDERGLSPKAEGVVVQTAQEDRAELVGPTLFALFGGSLVLLIIACANVGTLSLTRLVERRRELAVRSSLGASRRDIRRQIVTEHVVLWSAGGAIGIGLGAAGLRLILGMEPLAGDALLAADTISIDGRIVLFAAALTLVTALAFGSLSAAQSSDSSPVGALREDGTTVSPPRRARLWRQSLVVAQVALSTVLASGACLLALSLSNLTSQPLGFRADELVTFRVQLPARDYPDQASRSRLQRELTAALRALPGVEGAATTSAPPLGTIIVGQIGLDAAEPRSEPPWAGLQAVDQDYFRTAGIALVEGRSFDSGDTAEGDPVVLVNATFAERYFPGQSAVAKRVALTPADDLRGASRIVGVVTDVKHAGLDWEYLPEIFVAYEQIPAGPLAGPLGADLFVLLRVPDALAPTEALLRQTVAAIDRSLPLMEIQTGGQIVAASARRARFRTAIMSGVAGLAVLLSGMGLWAVVAQNVAQRRKEFGIRIALGATPASLLENVCRFGLTLAGIGIVAGVLTAIALARYMQSLLFGVSAAEPIVLAGVAGFMLAVTAVAAAVPGWRTTTLDPAIAIKR